MNNIDLVLFNAMKYPARADNELPIFRLRQFGNERSNSRVIYQESYSFENTSDKFDRGFRVVERNVFCDLFEVKLRRLEPNYLRHLLNLRSTSS